MKNLFNYLLLICLILSPMAVCAQEDEFDMSTFEKLIPLHEVKLPPGPHDWMTHHREADQGFYEYIKSNPVKPDENRKYIYIVQLGQFDQSSHDIIEKTSRYIEAYFNLEVKWMDDLDLEMIPPKAKRLHPQTKDKQILTSYVLEDILKPVVPDDAISLIAFTSSDLWPGAGWNFVFGQASITDRVGVWSIYRNGNPKKSEKENKLCLLRTIKTGTHELGHMISMHHCPYYECNMNGSNHRQESDRRPLHLCPVCLSKLTYNNNIDPTTRFINLIEISEEFGLEKEIEFFKKSLETIQK